MMTESPDRSSEIAAYRLAVERHLSDLRTADREELLVDLESHLAEVASELEPGLSLAERVGSPEAYARELREAMAVERETSWARLRRAAAEAFAPLSQRARRTADRFAASAGAGDAAELRRSLVPGWWVLRGALAAALFMSWLVAMGVVMGYPLLSHPVGLLMVVAVAVLCVWGSLKLGRRSERWSRRGRLLLAAGGVALAVLVGSQAFNLVAAGGTTSYQTVYEEGDRFGHVTDLYVYDADGNLLTGVYVFDQHGDPLRIGDPYQCDAATHRDPFDRGTVDFDGRAEQQWAEVDDRLGFAYPLCVIEVGSSDEPTAESEPSDQPTDVDPTEPAAEEPSESPEDEPTSGAPTEDAKDADGE